LLQRISKRGHELKQSSNYVFGLSQKCFSFSFDPNFGISHRHSQSGNSWQSRSFSIIVHRIPWRVFDGLLAIATPISCILQQHFGNH
jgi:hypothetical protein